METAEQEAQTLIRTKLYRPRASGNLITRSRLLQKLNQGLNRQLTLVSAPAGFGKTTLVASWLKQLPIVNDKLSDHTSKLIINHSSWLSINPGDNDPGRFFAYLVAAMESINPGFGEAIMASMRSPQLPPPEMLIGGLINEIAAGTDSFVLVLDDYHLIQNRFVHDSLSYLLEHQPRQMHLVIVTREDPSIALARLRARGEVVDIRQGDLRFTVEETAVFLNDLMGLDLSPAQIVALEARTEGWIAGLQLAALSMRERDDLQQFVQSFTGSNRYIMEYLIEEVFQQQSEEIQAFLLKTSILDRLCGPLCDAVLGHRDDGTRGCGDTETRRQGNSHRVPGSQAILESLERANLFIVPLDDEKRWYRYHHLFADLLHNRFLQDGLPVGPLHGRASQWYEANGYATDAVDQALSAQEWPRVAELIEVFREGLLQQGQIATLLRWIGLLPDEIVQVRPQLCFTAAWALALAGQLEAAEHFVDLVVPLTDQDPRLVNETLILQAHIARGRHDVPRTIELSQRALSLTPADDFNARSILGVNLGAAYQYAGDLDRAMDIWAEAARAGELSGNFHAGGLSLTFMGQVKAARGQLHQAASLHRQAIGLGSDKGPLPATARAHVNLATLCYEWNDLKSAGEHLEQALKLSRQGGDTNAERDAHRVLVQVWQAGGDDENALKAMGHAQNLIQEGEAPDNAILATAATHVRLSLAQGDLPRAERWIERIDETFPDTELVRPDLVANAGCLSAQIELVRVRLLLAQGRKKAAATLAAECYQAATEAGLGYDQVNSRILQALTNPDPVGAVDMFADALKLARMERYQRTFLDGGEGVRELLTRAIGLAIVPDYTARLLESFKIKGEEQPAVQAPQFLLTEPLSDREQEILVLLAEHQSNVEIAQALFLSKNTVKTHLRHIYEKLGVHDRRAAVSRGRELNLI